MLALEPTDRVLFQTLKQKAWISSSESCLWQGGKHLLTWSVIVSSFPIHTQCGPWRQKDLRMFPRHIYLYLQVFVIEWRHLTKVIKPKFGMFETKNVPIALFSAASRVAFDKGTVIIVSVQSSLRHRWELSVPNKASQRRQRQGTKRNKRKQNSIGERIEREKNNYFVPKKSGSVGARGGSAPLARLN